MLAKSERSRGVQWVLPPPTIVILAATAASGGVVMAGWLRRNEPQNAPGRRGRPARGRQARDDDEREKMTGQTRSAGGRSDEWQRHHP